MGKHVGYKIKIEAMSGEKKAFNCKMYQHTNDGILLSFDDGEPDLFIEKSTYIRCWVGPADLGEGHSQINS